MTKYLLWVWQLPQNLIGLIIFIIHKNDRIDAVREFDSGRVKFWYVHNFFNSGISLGNYIFLDKIYLGMSSANISVKHEHGHQIQSLILGPLYLLLIGLPSLMGNIIDRIFHFYWPTDKRMKWYYSQPWEKWADKLGDVKRFL